VTATWLASPHLLAVNLLNPTSLLSALGALAVLIVLFCETVLLLGFFLPGDSRLVGQQHRPLLVADHRRGHRRQSHPRPAGDPARSPRGRLRVTRAPAVRLVIPVPGRRT